MNPRSCTARFSPALHRWWWLCLLCSGYVCAGKIGYVDMDELINKSPQILAAREKLTAERARLLDRQIRRFKEDLKDAISIRNSQILDEIQDKLKDTVSAYAQENGYDAILINAILYVSEEIDLTDEILQRLRQEQQKSQTSETPRP